jgi:hypothetical protein
MRGAQAAAGGRAQPASRQADAALRRAAAVRHDGSSVRVETAGRSRRGTHPPTRTSRFRRQWAPWTRPSRSRLRADTSTWSVCETTKKPARRGSSITPEVLDHIRAGDEDEERVVRRTAEFLIAHQGVADFPEIVELEDVISTYGDFIHFMTR